MIRILKQIIRTGIVTEPLPPAADEDMPAVSAELAEAIRKHFSRSLTIRQVDAGSCNGCELEIHALNNPVYNCERLGIRFTASPRFADLLMVTGPVTHNMEVALRRTYNATPTPRMVMAVGDCGYNGGIFGESYASLGGVGNVIPVNCCVKGCPPSPEKILRGLLQLLGQGAKGLK